MSDAPQVEVWERGQDNPPPSVLLGLMIGGEQLLWSATVPSRRLQFRWLCSVAICLSLTAYLLHYVWGQTMTEYCGTNRNARCSYPVAWLLIAVCTFFAGYLLQLIWRNHFAPWPYFFGISTKRALLVAGHKPSKVYSAQLERHPAAIDWFGSVRFGSFRTGLSFAGLDARDAERAIYWANEGRVRFESSDGAEA